MHVIDTTGSRLVQTIPIPGLQSYRVAPAKQPMDEIWVHLSLCKWKITTTTHGSRCRKEYFMSP
jgi:hypothetical protein